MHNEREVQIKERIQERYDITEELYSAWFTKEPALVVEKDRFYQTEYIEKHRAISYLLDKGYIVAQTAENDPKMVVISITPAGIDFYEQGYLSGKAKGWQVVIEQKDSEG
ncbi:hypothetical protein J7E78_21080 [Paenibacillus polymyxa]|uniref:hypothetical protein n=1 Tax=Paenibacillus polymyxa TaxID=1406 RepID=UPI001BEB3C30|nr:hypothetical protein [Paenibacillus polymyxa]MBT2286037.1 hypothetical protein [Paenibacillus polymyxa]